MVLLSGRVTLRHHVTCKFVPCHHLSHSPPSPRWMREWRCLFQCVQDGTPIPDSLPLDIDRLWQVLHLFQCVVQCVRISFLIHLDHHQWQGLAVGCQSRDADELMDVLTNWASFVAIIFQWWDIVFFFHLEESVVVINQPSKEILRAAWKSLFLNHIVRTKFYLQMWQNIFTNLAVDRFEKSDFISDICFSDRLLCVNRPTVWSWGTPICSRLSAVHTPRDANFCFTTIICKRLLSDKADKYRSSRISMMKFWYTKIFIRYKITEFMSRDQLTVVLFSLLWMNKIEQYLILHIRSSCNIHCICLIIQWSKKTIWNILCLPEISTSWAWGSTSVPHQKFIWETMSSWTKIGFH